LLACQIRLLRRSNSERHGKQKNRLIIDEYSYLTHDWHSRHSWFRSIRVTKFVLAPPHNVSNFINDILKIGRTRPQADRFDKRVVLDGRSENQNRKIGVGGIFVHVIGMDPVT